ncbi:MAG: dockerin type I repeat-containing protein, partial [Muribaculaceae bacterium]|nr:dockerin type I repeat-containing protein [Muribaculaceae bacterium]
YSNSNNTITMEKVVRVPANTGVILANLAPGAIYKIPRALSASGASVLKASSTSDVNVNALTGGYYWDCEAKKFCRPSNTSRPYYTGSGRSYLNFSSSRNFNEYYTSLWPNTPDFKKGDVNGDGEVDVTDANILTNIILGKDSAGNYGGRADVDGNGSVDVSDANMVTNIILGK